VLCCSCKLVRMPLHSHMTQSVASLTPARVCVCLFLCNFPLCVCFSFVQDLLSDRSRVLRVVLEEARSVAAKHGQPRRSRILVRAGRC
jgi:hypothetical protein